MPHERALLIVEIAVIIAVIATVPLTIAELRGRESLGLSLTDWLVWGVFLSEYVFLLAISDDRRSFVRERWFLLLVVVLTFPYFPDLFQLLRLPLLTRIARLVRLAAVVGRGFRGAQLILARRGLMYVLAVSVFLIFVGGGIFAEVEPSVEDQGLWAGVWWAIVTTTTVGYGDISPETLTGRLVAVVLMVVGIGVVSTLAATIAAYFVDEDAAANREILDRLERIEALLAEQQQRSDD